MGAVTTIVAQRPPCDVCKSVGITKTALYDARMKSGSGAGKWAYLCTPHFNELGCELGSATARSWSCAKDSCHERDRHCGDSQDGAGGE